MPGGLFAPNSRYRKPARWAAILWTIAISVACLWPGNELPHSDIPFIDKWTHFVMFGVFSFLWLCAYPDSGRGGFVRVLLISVAYGVMVELLQAWQTRLGRSGELLDAIADSVGGLLGVMLFWLVRKVGSKPSRTISGR